MKDLEENMTEEFRKFSIETIIGAAKFSLIVLPIAALTTAGIAFTVYGATKKEAEMTCLGAAMTLTGAGLMGVYTNSVRRMFRNKRDDNEHDEYGFKD